MSGGEGIHFSERVEALLPYVEFGPGYIRGVADELSTARYMAARERWEEAEHWLEQAEAVLQTVLQRREATA